MKAETFHLELITPCFCAGAEPDQQAEIRAPSIRGQLRWWFRTLGGFRSLASMSVREQEAMIFGSTAGNDGTAGKLVVRLASCRVADAVRDGQEIGHRSFSDPAYLTFPIQTRERLGQKVGYNGRGVLLEGNFALQLLWRGDSTHWPGMEALVSIFAHLGALGFRGRRAMGALAFSHGSMPVPLQEALKIFSQTNAITVRTLGACAQAQVIPNLGKWLKRWRAYGRTGKNNTERAFPGFSYAEADHDHGAAVLARNTTARPTFRATLGLPIVQFFSSSHQTVNWEYGRGNRDEPKGRFASPVLLRPHRDAAGNWHALVIFVDAHKWPNDPATGRPKQVFLNGQPRAVSLDLYEAMKNDPNLATFP